MAILRSLMIAVCVITATLGLLGFALFLWRGPIGVVTLGFPEVPLLLWNTALSLVFFAQHSGMIRTRFRHKLIRFMPQRWFGLVYAAASGLLLIGFVLLWQSSDVMLYAADGVARWLLRGLFLAAGVGMLWGVRALQSFDLLGLHAVSRTIPVEPTSAEIETPGEVETRAEIGSPTGLQIRGPYRWVRHPMYSLALVMIWTFPDLSLDRCLFNVLWTAWIAIGARLEERDLATEFGDAYAAYQRCVPMLIPRYLRPPAQSTP